MSNVINVNPGLIMDNVISYLIFFDKPMVYDLSPRTTSSHQQQLRFPKRLSGMSSKNSSKGPSSMANEKLPVVELIPLLGAKGLDVRWDGPWLTIWRYRNLMMKEYLVGGIPTPLKNMSSSVGIMTFPIYGVIKNVPNQQPDTITHLHQSYLRQIFNHHQLSSTIMPCS